MSENSTFASRAGKPAESEAEVVDETAEEKAVVSAENKAVGSSESKRPARKK